MLTKADCELIRKNWDAANCMDSDSVAEMGERHVPALLATVEELRELLLQAEMAVWSRASDDELPPSASDTKEQMESGDGPCGHWAWLMYKMRKALE